MVLSFLDKVCKIKPCKSNNSKRQSWCFLKRHWKIHSC